MEALWAALRLRPIEHRGPRARWECARAHVGDPFCAAVYASRGAHTVGEAFFSGYQAAVEQLTGQVAVQALLVTEKSGQHPRDLRTRVSQGLLTGQKSFVLDDVDQHWVLATAGVLPDGRADLVLASVDAKRAQTTPVASAWLTDVPHSIARYDSVQISRSLPDAWARYVRPFRIVEDIGVLAAVCSARMSAEVDPEAAEVWLALLLALWGLYRASPSAPETVRALAGVRARFDAECGRTLDGPLAQTWERDSRVFGIGRGARATRLLMARAEVASRHS